MRVVELIRNKRDGQELSAEELQALVKAYTDGEVPDYQIAAFLMAVFFQSMTPAELAAWTDAMLKSGNVLDLSHIEGFKVDKHSTGGVGDKVSLILAPLAVAAGLKVPMISGRGLGHTGGTLDKLESIPGFDVFQPVAQFCELVDKLGCGLIGQTEQIAPADKKLYALRDVTATVECIPLIASSIMSKKLAEGIDALVLDVKVGSGAFMKEMDQARELARTMIHIGQSMNRPVRALITNMNQPLGLAVGNSLEVIESIDTLKGKGPEDLTDLTVELVYEMLDVVGLAPKGRDETVKWLHQLLEDGTALQVFKDIIEAQGGDPLVCEDYQRLPQAHSTTAFTAWKSGYLSAMDTRQIGVAAMELGAGRRTKEDGIDPAVGLVFERKLGDYVHEGDTLLMIHHNPTSNFDACVQRLTDAIELCDNASSKPELILDRLTEESA